LITDAPNKQASSQTSTMPTSNHLGAVSSNLERDYFPSYDRGNLASLLVGSGIEWLALAFYVCLIYKQAALGIAVLCLIIILGVFVRLRYAYVASLLGLLSIAYESGEICTNTYTYKRP